MRGPPYSGLVVTQTTSTTDSTSTIDSPPAGPSTGWLSGVSAGVCQYISMGLSYVNISLPQQVGLSFMKNCHISSFAASLYLHFKWGGGGVCVCVCVSRFHRMSCSDLRPS